MLENFYLKKLMGAVPENEDFNGSSYYSLLSNQKIRTLLNILIYLHTQNEKLELRIAELERKTKPKKRSTQTVHISKALFEKETKNKKTKTKK